MSKRDPNNKNATRNLVVIDVDNGSSSEDEKDLMTLVARYGNQQKARERASASGSGSGSRGSLAATAIARGSGSGSDSGSGSGSGSGGGSGSRGVSATYLSAAAPNFQQARVVRQAPAPAPAAAATFLSPLKRKATTPLLATDPRLLPAQRSTRPRPTPASSTSAASATSATSATSAASASRPAMRYSCDANWVSSKCIENEKSGEYTSLQTCLRNCKPRLSSEQYLEYLSDKDIELLGAAARNPKEPEQELALGFLPSRPTDYFRKVLLDAVNIISQEEKFGTSIFDYRYPERLYGEFSLEPFKTINYVLSDSKRSPSRRYDEILVGKEDYKSYILSRLVGSYVKYSSLKDKLQQYKTYFDPNFLKEKIESINIILKDDNEARESRDARRDIELILSQHPQHQSILNRYPNILKTPDVIDDHPGRYEVLKKYPDAKHIIRHQVENDNDIINDQVKQALIVERDKYYDLIENVGAQQESFIDARIAYIGRCVSNLIIAITFMYKRKDPMFDRDSTSLHFQTVIANVIGAFATTLSSTTTDDGKRILPNLYILMKLYSLNYYEAYRNIFGDTEILYDHVFEQLNFGDGSTEGDFVWNIFRYLIHPGVREVNYIDVYQTSIVVLAQTGIFKTMNDDPDISSQYPEQVLSSIQIKDNNKLMCTFVWYFILPFLEYGSFEDTFFIPGNENAFERYIKLLSDLFQYTPLLKHISKETIDEYIQYSEHRGIVNSMPELWGKLFGKMEYKKGQKFKKLKFQTNPDLNRLEFSVDE